MRLKKFIRPLRFTLDRGIDFRFRRKPIVQGIAANEMAGADTQIGRFGNSLVPLFQRESENFVCCAGLSLRVRHIACCIRFLVYHDCSGG
jgi:hypothetical protein